MKSDLDSLIKELEAGTWQAPKVEASAGALDCEISEKVVADPRQEDDGLLARIREAKPAIPRSPAEVTGHVLPSLLRSRTGNLGSSTMGWLYNHQPGTDRITAQNRDYVLALPAVGRKTKRESRADELRCRLITWRQMPESLAMRTSAVQ